MSKEALGRSLTMTTMDRMTLLYKVGVALSAEKDRDRLVEMILLEAKRLCNADGGTLYLCNDADELEFDILHTDSLGFAAGGTSGKEIDLPPVPLYDPQGSRNIKNIASYAALAKKSINISDAYNTTDFDFSGTRAFDKHNQYRSTSFLTIPLVNSEDRMIGVLQLINAQSRATGEVIPFKREDQEIVEALASQAAIALDNQLLLDGQKRLLESFIRLIASAIDAKSPYTGGHCERVPVLAEMVMRAVCEVKDGPFAGYSLDDQGWEELRIGAWLHDCGKITTPVHVMDKSTKLETIFDRIEVLRPRFEVLRREEELVCLRAQLEGGDKTRAETERDARLTQIDDDFAFLQHVNVGGEFLGDADKERIRHISERMVKIDGHLQPLVLPEEVKNLSISRGSLSEDERLTINGHMVQTIAMLEALPFPRHLQRVPEYAGGHHERMDGKGYPRGLYAGDMSVPARAMAIADVFEALTAQDRPYKKGKTLSEAMRIMGFMKRDNHIDPALFDLFVSSGVYREYGARYLPTELIDDVNEEELIAIEAKVFELPCPDIRQGRSEGMLPEYAKQRTRWPTQRMRPLKSTRFFKVGRVKRNDSTAPS
ncbi:MAG: GAF domain-containing protein [Deltaproteobacteria bacterium]|nr:GAF domain-containing protein [Deltaproteobacteria bacterium]